MTTVSEPIALSKQTAQPPTIAPASPQAPEALEPEPPAQTHRPSLFRRINMEPNQRLYIVPLSGFLSGAVAGAYIGGRHAGWQYLAERAHNLPTTVSGWYYYHKWKNYKILFGAFRKGLAYGSKIGSFTALYQVVEAGCDRYLFDRTCMLSSLVSGLVTSATSAALGNLSYSILFSFLGFTFAYPL